MKKLSSVLFYLFVLGFMATSVMTTHELFSLKGHMLRVFNLSQTQYDLLRPYLQKINIYLGISYGCGLLFFLFYILSQGQGQGRRKIAQENKLHAAQDQGAQTKENGPKTSTEQAVEDAQANLEQHLADKSPEHGMLKGLCAYMEAVQGLRYQWDEAEGKFTFAEGYAFLADQADRPTAFAPNEGLVGHAASNKVLFVIEDLPEGYVKAESGLGESVPAQLVIVPLVDEEGNCPTVFELATFRPITEANKQALEQWRTGKALLSPSS